MPSHVLIAQYPKQQAVRDRNYAGLLAWAGYVATAPIPDAPDDAWVRLRIVAERMPDQIDNYVQRTLPYFVQDPQTLDRLNEFLSGFNDDAVESELADTNSQIIGAFMPRFAASDVTDEQVELWLTDHTEPPV